MTLPLPTLPVFFHSFIASSDSSLTNLQGESSTQQFQTNDHSITFCINGRLLTEHDTLFAMVNKVPVGDKRGAIPSDEISALLLASGQSRTEGEVDFLLCLITSIILVPVQSGSHSNAASAPFR